MSYRQSEPCEVVVGTDGEPIVYPRLLRWTGPVPEIDPAWGGVVDVRPDSSERWITTVITGQRMGEGEQLLVLGPGSTPPGYDYLLISTNSVRPATELSPKDALAIIGVLGAVMSSATLMGIRDGRILATQDEVRYHQSAFDRYESMRDLYLPPWLEGWPSSPKVP